MADVALDPLHPIQLGHIGIRNPFDDVLLHVAERGALLVPQVLEILESLHFVFPPEGYRSEMSRSSGQTYNVRLMQPPSSALQPLCFWTATPVRIACTK